MKLTHLEIGSPLWAKLVAHYEPKLVTYRARLENPNIPETERIALCWQIKSIKEFLALAEPELKKETSAG